MSRRVDLKPSKVEADRDVVQYRDDGGYLLMADFERRELITWINKVTYKTYDGYDKAFRILEGRKE